MFDHLINAAGTLAGITVLGWGALRLARRRTDDAAWLAELQADEDELRAALDLPPLNRGRENVARVPRRRRPSLVTATARDLPTAAPAITAAPRALPTTPTGARPRTVVGEVVASSAGNGPAGPPPLYLTPRRDDRARRAA